MGSVTRTRSRDFFEHRLSIGLYKGLLAWGMITAQRASELAPFDTGRLARSIHAGEPFEIAPAVWAILVGTNVEYARAHELGSGIHASDPAERELILIEPVNAQALAFEWPNGPDIPAFDPESGLYFFARVFHPGVPMHPYLRPALEQTREEGERITIAAITAEMRRN